MQLPAELDSRDTAFNPTRGLAVALDYMKSDNSLGADRDWERAEIGVGMAVPLRRDVLWVTVAGGTDLTATCLPTACSRSAVPTVSPASNRANCGSTTTGSPSTSYLWKVKDVLPIRNLALYVGVGLTGGEIYDRLDGGDDGELYGGSVFLTGRTLFGPLTLGIGTTRPTRGACG